MTNLGIAINAILCFIGIILTIVILMQSKRSAGLGAVSASNQDTYWSKNKGNSAEGALEKYTKIGAFIFIFLCLISNFVN